jgi:hypothetical protein
MSKDNKNALAKELTRAWARYTELFGETPHGRSTQFCAMVELMRDKSFSAAPDMLAALQEMICHWQGAKLSPLQALTLKRMQDAVKLAGGKTV